MENRFLAVVEPFSLDRKSPPDAFQEDFITDKTSGETRENFHAVIKNAFSRVVRQPRQIFHLFREPTSCRRAFAIEKHRAKINVILVIFVIFI